MIGSTAAPTGGVPSLTTSEITQLYQQYLGRSPDASELSSEMENALKYSAAGIERQIANRAGNVAGSGVRGDEGAPSLTVYTPPPPVASIVTAGPSVPTATTPPTVGSIGLANPSAPINYATMQPGAHYGYSGGSGGYDGSGIIAGTPYAAQAQQTGMSLVTWAILGGIAIAAYYLLNR